MKPITESMRLEFRLYHLAEQIDAYAEDVKTCQVEMRMIVLDQFADFLEAIGQHYPEILQQCIGRFQNQTGIKM